MTLIEVMVVVFIIGLTAGLVVMTLPDRATPERAAAQTLAVTLSQAQDRAIMSGQPVGLIMSERGYMLAAWTAGRWEPLRGGESVPRSVRLDLTRDTRNPPPDGWPDLVFDPTGVTDGAAFRLRGKQEQFQITLATSGEVQVEAR